jgi:hypothetical protein
MKQRKTEREREERKEEREKIGSDKKKGKYK